MCVSTAGGGKAREAEARETDQVRRLRCAACRQLGNNRHYLNLFFSFSISLSLSVSLYLCISLSLEHSLIFGNRNVYLKDAV